MLKAFTFLFVFMTPLLYVSGGMTFWKFAGGLVLVLGYYGIREVSQRLVDPFGWNRSDIDLEHFGIAIERNGNMLTTK
jgi:predicted membrane chloride channel (bestrophin family)